MGVAFGYYLIAPLRSAVLENYELGDVASRIAVMSYVKTVASITLWPPVWCSNFPFWCSS